LDIAGATIAVEENEPVSEPPPAHSDNTVFELSLEKRMQLQQNLKALLEKDEIYKDPELSLDKICEMLATNRSYLSRVINQDMGTTFYQMINTCRINKSKSMMSDPLHRHTPLKNIADLCGFNRLSTFSILFKQACGKTPSEWREEEGTGGDGI
jgi:AraC-like DNA-binding protein